MSINMTEANVLKAFSDLKRYREFGTVEEVSQRIKEEDVLKFYYCESQDEYYIGRRVGTMYYARVIPETFCVSFVMSRYLPWGMDNYPSEPKEIPFSDWLKGYIEKYLT